MENKKTFGDYVKTKRVETGFTQKEFADKLYVTESAVSKWERGLSYPDITLITEICKILDISEHELLTASIDTKARTQEKLAKRYTNIVKTFIVTQFFMYGIALLTCFIVNLAVSRALTWFFIVLTAIAVAASLTLLPSLLKKKRGLITLGSFTAALLLLLLTCAIFTSGEWFVIAAISVLFGLSIVFLPFVLRGIYLPAPFNSHKALIYFAFSSLFLLLLLLVLSISTGGGWFFSVACPIALFSLLFPWGLMLIIRYVTLSKSLKTAACLGLSSVFIFFLRGYPEMVLGQPYRFGFSYNFSYWNTADYINGNIDAIMFFVLSGLAVIFAITGIVKEMSKTK